MMQSLVGIVRTKEDLESALGKIAELRERAAQAKVGGNIQYNPGWHVALDLKNMLDISEAVTRAALERTESRGAHTREDFPETDKEWGTVNVIVRQSRERIGAVREPLEAPLDLRAGRGAADQQLAAGAEVVGEERVQRDSILLGVTQLLDVG